ncbi:hypothetical protein [Maridesulfovibrio sp.]|uniref:hypothetical protein n=1 Tax=Maridesulfovibrio sp. TaxID=2795000 RepID=UPI002A18A4B3|nr:hypothetical protein [Maridesulfovibrio sp.]
MASGLGYMAVSSVASVAIGAATRAVSGQKGSWGNVGTDAFGGALSGAGSSVMSSGSSLMSSSSVTAVGSSSGSSAGSATDSSGSLLGGLGNSGSYLGMMSQFGQSVLGGSEQIGDAQYNSRMTELRNYRTVQQGVYGRAASYKEAEIVNREAEMELAALRRELYRRNHSLGAYRGVRLDSGSIVDAREDLIKQADYDMEIVKYQAEVDSGRYIDQGNMAVWTAESASVLNTNDSSKETQETSSAVSKSLLNTGMSMAGSLLSSK